MHSITYKDKTIFEGSETECFCALQGIAKKEKKFVSEIIIGGYEIHQKSEENNEPNTKI